MEQRGARGPLGAAASCGCWASLARGPAWQLEEEEELARGSAAGAGAWNTASSSGVKTGPLEKIELKGSSSPSAAVLKSIDLINCSRTDKI